MNNLNSAKGSLFGAFGLLSPFNPAPYLPRSLGQNKKKILLPFFKSILLSGLIEDTGILRYISAFNLLQYHCVASGKLHLFSQRTKSENVNQCITVLMEIDWNLQIP